MNRTLKKIEAERARQDEKWGQRDYPDGTGPRVVHAGFLGFMEEQAKVARMRCWSNARTQDNWRDILLEEVYEAMAEDDPHRLATELVEVAAVAVAWVEAIERRTPTSSLDISDRWYPR